MQHDKPSPKPRHDKKIIVKFRNGEVSKYQYTASQLRWGVCPKTGPSDWDIMAVRVVG